MLHAHMTLWLTDAVLAFYHFLHPIHDNRPSCLSLPLSRSFNPGLLRRFFSSPPSTIRALQYYREDIPARSSLADPRPIVPTHTPE